MLKGKRQSGFTLVELLAVIVLLGILTIISFPKILEMVNRKKEEISTAKLNMIYTATKTYLFDNANKYPEREGNTFCIKPSDLEKENYVAFDTTDLDSDYVVKVSYFADDEYQLSYVKSSSCEDNGFVNSELAGLSCTIDKTGYSISKKVTISYPQGEGLEYQYSLDNGQNWSIVESFDEGNKIHLYFNSTGSVLARVKDDNSSLSCTAYVEQIDPTPVGTIVAYAGEKIPAGYLLADGSSVTKIKYPDLYDVLGNSYGEAANSKAFVLPNLSGRLIVGMDANDNDFAYMNTGGEKTHPLTVDELPAHTHTFTGTENLVTSASGAHTHTFNGTTSESGSHSHEFTTGGRAIIIDNTDGGNALAEMGFESSATGWWAGSPKTSSSITSSASHSHTLNGTTSSANTTHTHTLTATGSNESVGGDSAHNNLMPYITLKYIIKYQ